MSHLEVNREPSKEDLCMIDELYAGEVGLDTECGDTVLVVSSDGILTDSIDQFLEKNDPDGNLPSFDGLENIVLAVSLESGELMKYEPPFRKIIKHPKSARLYVKE